MPSPSPNHGTLRPPNDDDGKIFHRTIPASLPNIIELDAECLFAMGLLALPFLSCCLFPHLLRKFGQTFSSAVSLVLCLHPCLFLGL